MQKIVNMEPQSDMTSAPNCYGESKQSENKDDHHINRVEIEEEDGDNEDVELIEPVNQYMAPPTPKFKVVSVD